MDVLTTVAISATILVGLALFLLMRERDEGTYDAARAKIAEAERREKEKAAKKKEDKRKKAAASADSKEDKPAAAAPAAKAEETPPKPAAAPAKKETPPAKKEQPKPVEKKETTPVKAAAEPEAKKEEAAPLQQTPAPEQKKAAQSNGAEQPKAKAGKKGSPPAKQSVEEIEVNEKEFVEAKTKKSKKTEKKEAVAAAPGSEIEAHFYSAATKAANDAKELARAKRAADEATRALATMKREKAEVEKALDKTRRAMVELRSTLFDDSREGELTREVEYLQAALSEARTTIMVVESEQEEQLRQAHEHRRRSHGVISRLLGEKGNPADFASPEAFDLFLMMARETMRVQNRWETRNTQ